MHQAPYKRAAQLVYDASLRIVSNAIQGLDSCKSAQTTGHNSKPTSIYVEMQRHNHKIDYLFGQLQKEITQEILDSPNFLLGEPLYLHVHYFTERSHSDYRSTLRVAT